VFSSGEIINFMACASCESPVSNYLIAAGDRFSTLLQNTPVDGRRSAMSRIRTAGQTAREMIPIVTSGVRATFLEMRNREISHPDVTYRFNENNQMIIASGPFEGMRPREFSDRTRRLRPDLYNPEDLQADLLMEAVFQTGGNQAVVIYPRDGNDNRNINVYKKDSGTGLITLTVINTGRDGNHDFTEITNLAKQYFPDFNNVLPSNSIKPDGHILVLSDIKVPEKNIEQAMKEFNPKRDTLQIQETQMRFDPIEGKVYAEDMKHREKDIEIMFISEAERKQKHRLVRLIKTAHACALKDGKDAAFYYSPDALDGVENQEKTVSQVIVNEKGHVVFQTIKLSSDLNDHNGRDLLLDLGYPGSNKKNYGEYTYTDDPRSKEDFKQKVQSRLNLQKTGVDRQFISFQIYSMKNEYPFLSERFNLDRAISNMPNLYLHEIGFSQEIEKKVEKTEKVFFVAETAVISLGALTMTVEDIKTDKINKIILEKKESDVAEKALDKTHHEILEDDSRFNEIIKKKKKRIGNSGNPSPDKDGPSPTIQFFLDREEDEEIKNNKKEKEKTNPKNPTPNKPSELFLETEIPIGRLSEAFIDIPEPSTPAPVTTLSVEAEDSSPRSTVENSQMQFEINHDADEDLFRMADENIPQEQIVAIPNKTMDEKLSVPKTKVEQEGDEIKVRIDYQPDQKESDKIFIELNSPKEISIETPKNAEDLVLKINTSNSPIGEIVQFPKQEKMSIQQMDEIWNLLFGLQLISSQRTDKLEIKDVAKNIIAKQEVYLDDQISNIYLFTKDELILAIIYLGVIRLLIKTSREVRLRQQKMKTPMSFEVHGKSAYSQRVMAEN
jgi:hypothetical protein